MNLQIRRTIKSKRKKKTLSIGTIKLNYEPQRSVGFLATQLPTSVSQRFARVSGFWSPVRKSRAVHRSAVISDEEPKVRSTGSTDSPAAFVYKLPGCKRFNGWQGIASAAGQRGTTGKRGPRLSYSIDNSDPSADVRAKSRPIIMVCALGAALASGIFSAKSNASGPASVNPPTNYPQLTRASSNPASYPAFNGLTSTDRWIDPRISRLRSPGG